MKFSIHAALAFGAAALVWAPAGAAEVRGRRQAKEADEDVSSVAVHRQLSVTDALPAQTFFVPLPEQSLFQDAMYPIRPRSVRPPVETVLSLTISTDKTVIWYDQWEDGFDQDVNLATSKTTEVWGDGDASNGCSPLVAKDKCTNSIDYLYAGDVIVIQETIPLPRDAQVFKKDGGDKIMASFPIAITRGAYPTHVGSVLAGAVEVLPTENWGLEFEAPVGRDVGRTFAGFEYSALFYMASEDTTTVTLPGGTKKTLNQGEGAMVKVNKSDKIVADKPIQVNLITADIGSNYETRWYTLRATNQYSKQYLSPVGDTIGKTKVLLYNPSSSKTIRVYVKSYYISRYGRVQHYNYYKDISPKQYGLTNIVYTGSGALMTSNDEYLALSMTDTEAYDANGWNTNSQAFDWGFPVVPVDELASQALVGWGFGCTNNNCYGQADRSVVWVSPMEDADVYVDYANNNSPKKYAVGARFSRKFTDTDDDMSGALIYATKYGSGPQGPSVKIAAAWGQDPSVSRPYQQLSLDLGTTVLPFDEVKVSIKVDKPEVSAGQELEYTIRISNVSQKSIPKDRLTVREVSRPDCDYIPGTTRYESKTAGVGSGPIADVAGRCGLVDSGFTLPVELSKRGGTVDVRFKCKVKTGVSATKISHKGSLKQVGHSIDKPFIATCGIAINPEITVENTVYLGHDDGAKCGTDAATKSQAGFSGDAATYCFKVTNTGSTHLINARLYNRNLGRYSKTIGTLAPGATTTVHVNKEITQALTNTVVAKGTPAHSNGNAMSGVSIVRDKDSSSVSLQTYSASVGIESKVYLSSDGGVQCNTNVPVDRVEDLKDSAVQYCFNITNPGTITLGKLRLGNPQIGYATTTIPGTLAPKESKMVPFPSSITSDLTSVGVVSGRPVLANGDEVEGCTTVTAKDNVAVGMVTLSPNVLIENTVYLGKDQGAKCGTPAAVEYVSDFFDADVTYCFKVTNNGETSLKEININNGQLSFTDSSIGTLASGASAMIVHEDTISASLKNVAVVTATPVTPDGRAVPGVDSVTDSDPSEVARKMMNPEVSIDNKVYLGDQNGRCGTEHAKDSVTDYVGSPVTYCFVVKNTGDSHLGKVVITNEALGFTKTLPNMGPSVAVTVPFKSKIHAEMTNTAVVTANPITDDGTDLPGQDDVTASDDSGVTTIRLTPSVKIEDSAYLGEDDNGAKCATGTDNIAGQYNEPLNYCFKVTNTGNTHLASFELEDRTIAFVDKTSIKVLAPGKSAVVSVPGTIKSPKELLTTVKANPVGEDGSDLPYADVSDTDTLTVDRLPFNNDVVIKNTVYLGSDDNGEACGTSVEKVSDIYYSDVVYCFEITNNGTSSLKDILVVDEDLDYEKAIDTVLAPGGTILLSTRGKILEDSENLARVTGTPVVPTGEEIIGADAVCDCDPSAVEKLAFSASINIENTCYLGTDEGAQCGTPAAGEFVEDYYGKPVVYCYEVENTGSTHLEKVSISDRNVVFFDTLGSTLAPGGKETLHFQSIITRPMVNIANVTANPVTPDGRDIADLKDVKDQDEAEVGMIKFAPSIEVTSKVYVGTDEEGSGCGTATDLVKDNYGTGVVYCLEVKNTGDTSLDSVLVINEELDVKVELEDPLPVGGSKLIPVVSKITTELVNLANVTGNPVLTDGRDIPHLEDVTDTDTSKVEVLTNKPVVGLINKVYVGVVSDDMCGTDAAMDSVEGYPNTGVVYCLTVTNEGDSHLDDIVLTDPVLNFTTTIPKMAPKDTKIITVPGTIIADVNNTAVVTANPVTETGEDIPAAEDVSSEDDSGVLKKDYEPSITISNTVFIGHNGGEGCGKNVAKELATGIFDTNVTYCLFVNNTGDTYLTDVVIVDEDIAVASHAVENLGPNEGKMVPVERKIKKNLVNTAYVTANPVTKDLVEIEHADVTANDPSEVEQVAQKAGIVVDYPVYIGDDGGVKCNTDEAVEVVEGIFGTPVTHCFTVTNVGDTDLNDVKLTNPKLQYTKTFSLPNGLPPGESVSVSVPGEITKDDELVVHVVGTPYTKTGTKIPDMVDVTDEDDAGLKKLDISAVIDITNTVKLGHDDGGPCSAGEVMEEKVEGLYGAECMYCFKVTNTGESWFDSLVVTNVDLDFVDTTSIKALGPEEFAYVSVPGRIDQEFVNTVKVKANPCLEDGTDIPDLDDSYAEDISAVALVAHVADIEIITKVYLGNDGGDSCSDPNIPVTYVDGYPGSDVVYCFYVTNSGESFLGDAQIDSTDLDFQHTIGKLAPGETVTVAFPDKLDETATNFANATGNPILENGEDIPNLTDVKDTDYAGVGLLEYAPSVAIENTVYLGDDSGAGCSTSVEKVTEEHGAKVVYCFKITNDGDTHLNNIVITDADLNNFEDNSIAKLAPNESAVVAFRSSIDGSLNNTAVVTANPILSSGADISGAVDVTDSDPSEVVEIIDGIVKTGEKDPYKPPTGPDKCIQNNWEEAAKEGELICAANEVKLEEIKSAAPKTCVAGDKIVINVDASIKVGGPRYDLGWYVATDGGNAMDGLCVVNGLQNGNTYKVAKSAGSTEASVGDVAWLTSNGGDDDKCGDISMTTDTANIDLPFIVETEVTCSDENEDGILDVAVCFTWRTAENNGMCDFSKNIPGELLGGCYCTRYDIPEIEVETPVDDPIAPCR